MAGPDDEVGVFAGLERADAVVDAELDGGVHGDEVECVLFGHVDAAELGVFECFAGFDMHSAGDIVGVGVVGSEQADFVVDWACEWDGVGDFDFVGPPVGEERSADGVLFDDLGDLVGFEAVLEGADFEIELLGDSAEHEDFVLAVGVGVDEAFASEDLGEGFEFEIAGEWRW